MPSFFANEGPGRGLQALDEAELETHLGAAHELGRHAPDTGFGSKQGAHYSVRPRHDPHEKAALRFIDRVVELVARAHERGDYDRLILIAPPRALGELRRRLPESVQACVVGELDQDLTKATTERIHEHIGRFSAA